MHSRTFEQDRVDLLCCRVHEAIGHLWRRGEPFAQSVHCALVKSLSILSGRNYLISACFRVGDAGLGDLTDFVLLRSSIIDEAKHGFFQERGRTCGTALIDLPLDHLQEFVRQLNRTHLSLL